MVITLRFIEFAQHLCHQEKSNYHCTPSTSFHASLEMTDVLIFMEMRETRRRCTGYCESLHYFAASCLFVEMTGGKVEISFFDKNHHAWWC